MDIKQQFTTVTRFSKIMALLLLIWLPFIGFYAGMKFQKTIVTDVAPIVVASPFIFQVSSMPTIPSNTPTTNISSNNDNSKIRITDNKINMSTYKDLPEQAVKFIPQNGILFASGGFMSSARRMAIDFDKKTLKYFEDNDQNADPFKISPNKEEHLTIDQIKKIVDMSNGIWESDKSFSNMPPIVDFEVTLIMSSYTDLVRYYKMIDSYGPPKEEVEELYDYVWSLVK